MSEIKSDTLDNYLYGINQSIKALMFIEQHQTGAKSAPYMTEDMPMRQEAIIHECRRLGQILLNQANDCLEQKARREMPNKTSDKIIKLSEGEL